MADLTAMLQAAAGSAGGEYEIERSLRFNSADSAYLSRTFSSPTSATIWTFSLWAKRGALGSTQQLLGASTTTSFGFNSSDQLNVTLNGTSAATSTAVFRDPSAWYHIVYQQNGSAQTIYVNNVSVATGTTAAAIFNTAIAHQIGAANTTNYYNGYMADVHFIDGQALTPSSFGETDAVTGVWKPIRYAGTYGTNGFHLEFADNSDVTATTLGKDTSGNGNNWTPNNFSVTAGAGNDSLVDSPTQYGTDTGAGGEVRGNYATLNPLRSRNSPTFSQGNMRLTGTTGSHKSTIITIPPVSGDKIYGEATVVNNTTGSTPIGFGFTDVASGAALPDPSDANLYIFYGNANGNIYNGTSLVTSGLGAPTAGIVIQVAYDKSNGYAWVGKANTWYDSSGGTTGNPSSGTNPTFTLTSNNLNFYLSAYDNSLDINFGQRPFAYTAPSGFKALCTTNLPDPTVVQGDDYFNTVLYTGNGTGQSITGVGFQPDWVWIKSRSDVDNNVLQDAVRGVTKQLFSNLTDAETNFTNGVTSFDSDGFTVATSNWSNESGETRVAWNWKANGAGSSNTDGTITSTASANQTAGISIVTYTGTGANATVGHGLGVAPAMVIVKSRDQGTTGYTGNWYVYHASNTAAPATDYLLLNTTAATADLDTVWNDTAPTSTVFSIGTLGGVNDSSDAFVAYCFAEVEGFSKFGSYTGNNSADGPFVYTGFRPAFILVKVTSTINFDWYLMDAKRPGYNVISNRLFPNLNIAEATTGDAQLDFLSNGFKLRSGNSNAAQTYIYAAFAENPFKFALAR